MIDIDNIRIDDLPEDCRQIAEIIGLNAMIDIVKARGGEQVYLPKAERLTINARNRMIRSEFSSGGTYRELARKHNLTVKWIREIIAEGKCKASEIDKQEQLSLFQKA